MKGRLFIVSLFIFNIFLSIEAQTQYYFYVQFNNKKNSTYTLQHPSDYLSTRAIERRATFHIAIDSTDLPVNQSYIDQISALGVKVHSRSKWMNGVTVLLNDSNVMAHVRTLNFVKFTQYTGKLVSTPASIKQKSKQQENDFIYGSATTQINQLNGTYLHQEGFTGRGIQIGVLDAGFSNVDVNNGFDSLRLQGRLLGTKDIILPGNNVYAEDTHGAYVLSSMAGNIAGQFLGTAPHASYWLIRTEYAPTEYLMETDFWVSGIEFADSVGVDVVNSSLGYTTFDDPKMNFTYNDMNGKVSRASRAATMAAEKAIVVCNSAGNEGNKPWKYISSPADADKIFTVGSVTSTGLPSGFSSFGPTADNRIKPDINAMGSNPYLINTIGSISNSGSGTSFSSPIMAGMLACFLQRYKSHDPNPDLNVLYNAVIQSSNNYSAPSDKMGYGIPDFVQAERNLPIYDGFKLLTKDEEKLVDFRQNANEILINKLSVNNGEINELKIYNTSGILLYRTNIEENSTVISTYQFSSGIYFITFTGSVRTQVQKLIIR